MTYIYTLVQRIHKTTNKPILFYLDALNSLVMYEVGEGLTFSNFSTYNKETRKPINESELKACTELYNYFLQDVVLQRNAKYMSRKNLRSLKRIEK